LQVIGSASVEIIKQFATSVGSELTPQAWEASNKNLKTLELVALSD
jgi:hypothetical protein